MMMFTFLMKSTLFLLYAAYSWMNCNEFPPVSLIKMQLIHPEKKNCTKTHIITHLLFVYVRNYYYYMYVSHKLKKFKNKTKNSSVIIIKKYVPQLQSITILSKFFAKLFVCLWNYIIYTTTINLFLLACDIILHPEKNAKKNNKSINI